MVSRVLDELLGLGLPLYKTYDGPMLVFVHARVLRIAFDSAWHDRSNLSVPCKYGISIVIHFAFLLAQF